MVGDNIYGSERPQDFVNKFESPYKAVLEAGVKFYASLGNHDSREQRYYKPYNMDGKLYYSLKAPDQDVRFFALDSTYLDQPQLEWLEKELSGAKEHWKIPFFHHPAYSSGGRHGSDLRIRSALEPLFVRYGVTVGLHRARPLLRKDQPATGNHLFRHGLGRPAGGGRHQEELTAHRARIRHRPGVHDGERGWRPASKDATERRSRKT